MAQLPGPGTSWVGKPRWTPDAAKKVADDLPKIIDPVQIGIEYDLVADSIEAAMIKPKQCKTWQPPL